MVGAMCDAVSHIMHRLNEITVFLSFFFFRFFTVVIYLVVNIYYYFLLIIAYEYFVS